MLDTNFVQALPEVSGLKEPEVSGFVAQMSLQTDLSQDSRNHLVENYGSIMGLYNEWVYGIPYDYTVILLNIHV